MIYYDTPISEPNEKITFFRRVFSDYTEAVTTSLIPIDAILPEICGLAVLCAQK